MSTQITTAFVQQYTNNFFQLAQQKGSRLKPSVLNRMQVGSSAFYDQIGASSAAVRSSRHSNTPQNDTPHSRRMVTLADYEWADLIDQQDKIRLLNDPTSEYVQSAMWALGRAIDDVIIAAATGTAATGVAGAGTATLGNAQKMVPSDGTTVSPFNLNALLAVKKKFDDNDIDESEERTIVVASQQLQDLLSDTKVTSADYNAIKALVQGELQTYCGFNFLRSQRLATGAAPTFQATTGIVGAGANAMTNARTVLAYAKSGLLLSIGQDPKGRISERDDKSYSTQVYASMSIGAVRMEETKVVAVYCKESNSVVS